MTLIPLLNSVSLIIIIRATGIHIMCILHFTSSSSNCTTPVGICFSFSESAAKSEIMFICLVKLASARLSHKLLMNPKKVADKSVEKLSKFLCFSYFFRVLRIKNSHIASYQNFMCPMIISEVLSISLDQQILYQNDMNKTWLYTHIMSRAVFM